MDEKQTTTEDVRRVLARLDAGLVRRQRRADYATEFGRRDGMRAARALGYARALAKALAAIETVQR